MADPLPEVKEEPATVYARSDGYLYHRDLTCYLITSGMTYYDPYKAIAVKEAERRGLSACTICLGKHHDLPGRERKPHVGEE